MTLYSADVFDLAKPVPKKGKGKKTESAQPAPTPEPVPETTVAVLEKPGKCEGLRRLQRQSELSEYEPF